MIISIVMPALEEEVGIRKTITSIPLSTLNRQGYETEIIVVDGDSKDRTREVARDMGSRVIVEKKRGYGLAYKIGLAAAKGDIIVTLDADGTYPADLIPEYVQKFISGNLDFMSINRFSQIENGAMSFSRRLGNKLLSAVIRILYSIEIKDSQSGMWIMRKSFFDNITLYSDDMSMSEEIKIVAFKFFRAAEVPGRYCVREGESKLNVLTHGWSNLKYLFTYRKLVKYAPKNLSELEEKI